MTSIAQRHFVVSTLSSPATVRKACELRGMVDSGEVGMEEVGMTVP